MGSPHRRLVLSHADDSAFAPHARLILGKLGYRIVGPQELDGEPALTLLDDRRLDRLADCDPSKPVVVLASAEALEIDDARVAGVVRQPADTSALYGLLQQLTEKTPRSTPRVPADLVASCRNEGASWFATLASISELGCLIRGGEPVALESRITLSFDLPGARRLELEAEAIYRAGAAVGLLFVGIGDADRDAIRAFIEQSLLG